ATSHSITIATSIARIDANRSSRILAVAARRQPYGAPLLALTSRIANRYTLRHAFGEEGGAVRGVRPFPLCLGGVRRRRFGWIFHGRFRHTAPARALAAAGAVARERRGSGRQQLRRRHRDPASGADGADHRRIRRDALLHRAVTRRGRVAADQR